MIYNIYIVVNMLSINYIAKFLSENQEVIENTYFQNLKKFEVNNDINHNISKKKGLILPESFDILFNKSIKDFYYNNKIFKNKSPVMTFINSILGIGNETFFLYSESEREQIIKEFIKKMDDDLFEKNLYYKFEYTKNRKFNKSDIQNVLQISYLFKNSDKFNLLKEYISDYLGINIYILHKKSDNFDISNSELYLTKRYNKTINHSLPNFILIFENEIYKPLLIDKEDNINSILKYSDKKDLIDNMWKLFNVKINNEKKIEIDTSPNIINNTEILQENNKNEEIQTTNKKISYNDIKNLKIDELKVMCNKYNISINKPSEKTGKLINKLKSELINDLLNT